MNKILFIIYLCLIAAELNCQVLKTDSSFTRQNKLNNDNINYTDTSGNFEKVSVILNEANNFIIPEDLFLLKLQFLSRDSLFEYSGQLSISPVPLTLASENTLLGNKQDFGDYFNNIYLQSRPTMLQNIMGDMNFAGGAGLAAYTLWKDYVKKRK
jgi:hypothetical protein